MKICILLLFLIINTKHCLFGQQKEEDFYQKIKNIASAAVNQIKFGRIEPLKYQNPPKDTWTFSKLDFYKNSLESEEDIIVYGEYIAPSSVISGIYGYNFYAYKKDGDSYYYYFVIVISVDARKDDLKIDGQFLFTEESALKNWWLNTLYHYQNDTFKTIPKKFISNICPPPPY